MKRCLLFTVFYPLASRIGGIFQRRIHYDTSFHKGSANKYLIVVPGAIRQSDLSFLDIANKDTQLDDDPLLDLPMLSLYLGYSMHSVLYGDASATSSLEDP